MLELVVAEGMNLLPECRVRNDRVELGALHRRGRSAVLVQVSRLASIGRDGELRRRRLVPRMLGIWCGWVRRLQRRQRGMIALRTSTSGRSSSGSTGTSSSSEGLGRGRRRRGSRRGGASGLRHEHNRRAIGQVVLLEQLRVRKHLALQQQSLSVGRRAASSINLLLQIRDRVGQAGLDVELKCRLQRLDVQVDLRVYKSATRNPLISPCGASTSIASGGGRTSVWTTPTLRGRVDRGGL